MNRFVDLVAHHVETSPGEQQLRAIERFPTLVEQSQLELWRPGNNIPRSGTRVLIGVALYSERDMELLDVLNTVLTRGGSLGDKVNVFDVSECRSHDDFEKYVPGIGPVFQTPVLGVWHRGLLTERMWGQAARDFIANRYGLQPS